MELKRQLTLKNGIALGIGSIIGSGILFLPSLTYSISGQNVGYVWLLAILLCLPLLVIFTEMVKKRPESSGIEGIVSLGLGETAGSSITLLIISTVIIGMPSASIVAGRYVGYLVQDALFVKSSVAFSIVAIGTITNLLKIKTGSKIQILVAAFLIFFGLGLILFSTEQASSNYNRLLVAPKLELIMPGLLASFWAFAGFENLTFVAGEFKNPARDFYLSMIISIFFCGLLYFFLSINFAALTRHEEIDIITGLYQLTHKGDFFSSFNYFLVTFAVFAVLLNFISWIYGISRLIYSSSKKGKFFSYFSKLDKKGVPSRSILLLAFLFSITLIIDMIFPHFIEEALILVSTNFVVIYILCICSYLKIVESRWKKAMAIFLLLILAFSALTSGLKLMYSIIVYLMGALIYKYRISREGI